MTSGRYRTLNQDMVDVYHDIALISQKMVKAGDTDGQEFAVKQIFGKNQQSFQDYQWLMSLAKDSKKQNLISNDEYKRFREFARYILPEGRMTELYVSFYWNDFLNYLHLRESTHAQTEHAYIAQKMRKILFEKNKDFFDNQ
jgi:thymidylate synthase ThyX